MNHRQIANLIVPLVQTDRDDRVRAIRLYVEKTTGVKVAETTQEELSNALVAAMDVRNVKTQAELKDAVVDLGEDK